MSSPASPRHPQCARWCGSSPTRSPHPPWVAAGLAFLAGTPALAISIVLVIVLDALFAFWQEHRADRSAERLRDLLPAIALGVEPPSNRVMFPLLAAVLLVLADAALKQLRSIRRRRTATEAIGRT